MDFNLQACRSLIAPQRQTRTPRSVLENARHRWLEMDGVVQSAMSLHQPARLCLPHQRSIAGSCQSSKQDPGAGVGRRISPSPGGTLARCHHDCVDLDARSSPCSSSSSPLVRGSPSAASRRCAALPCTSAGELRSGAAGQFSQDGNPCCCSRPPLYQALASRLSGNPKSSICCPTRLEQAQAPRWQRSDRARPTSTTCPATHPSSCTDRQQPGRASTGRSEEPAKCAGIASCPPVNPDLPCHPYIPAAREVTGPSLSNLTFVSAAKRRFRQPLSLRGPRKYS